MISAINGSASGAGLAAALLADVAIMGARRSSSMAIPAWAWRPAITVHGSGHCCADLPRPIITCSPAIRCRRSKPSVSGLWRCAWMMTTAGKVARDCRATGARRTDGAALHETRAARLAAHGLADF